MTRTTSFFISLVFGLSVNLGCSTIDEESEQQKEDEEECRSITCMEPPENGFQIRSEGTMILPGEDIEYCEIVRLPGTAETKYYVNRFESAMTEGSHHLIVSAVQVGSDTEKHLLEKLDIGEQIQCRGAGDLGGNFYPVTGAQTPYNQVQYPEGVGRVYTGGQYIVFDYHYFNTSDSVIPAQAAINFYTVNEGDIVKTARGFGFYNLNIYTAPMSSSSHTAECLFDEDIHVYALSRHTHRWGTNFSVYYSGGERDGELVWTSPHYEEKLSYVWEDSIIMKKGTGFRFQCDFVNDTDRPIVFGLKATDEMCILFGTWWKVDGTSPGSQSCQLF